MASIFAKRGKLWMGWIEKDSMGNVLHPQVNLGLNDTKENRKIANQIRKQKEVELKISPSTYVKKIKYSDAKISFLAKKKNKAASTLSIYTYSLDKLNGLSNKYLQDITKQDVQILVEKLRDEGKSEITIRTYLKNIKIFFQDCIREKLLAENPVELIKVNRNNVVKIISDDELKTIFKHFKKRNIAHYYLLKVLNSTGLRISEAVNLKWCDVNFEKKTILINNTKGKRIEEIPLIEEAEHVLRTIPRSNEKVLGYKSKASLNCLRNELQKFGYSFHDFRRTFGTRWAKKLKAFELKKIMRHKDLRTTDKYYVNIELEEIRNKMNNLLN